MPRYRAGPFRGSTAILAGRYHAWMDRSTPPWQEPTAPPSSGELTAWWWNGRWGKLARRDVKVFRMADGLVDVEAWDGRQEGRCRSWPSLTPEVATELTTDLMSDSDGWQS